CARKEDSLDLW
nr:immunoglobulin heavy chain junction region [Macaca mulatta]MOY21592.1 immunoglobulin heavy chain junction region [Macaca mulatta]MOY24477.1 immunoglobulin heavy chain junction region [Macaca mulatta]MOY24961.1 immunoglobulin heavy chain junction region [Macaca mulatta]MOY25073.1 immunoglobulin heavy chain junction region [Macaca mulatta]